MSWFTNIIDWFTGNDLVKAYRKADEYHRNKFDKLYLPLKPDIDGICQKYNIDFKLDYDANIHDLLLFLTQVVIILHKELED